MGVEGKAAPTAQTVRAQGAIYPRLPWLSLAESLPSVARLRFTRQVHCTKDTVEVTEEDSRKIELKNST